MKKIMEHNRKGFVLVLSLLTTAILLALVMPYVSRVVTDYGLTSKIYNSTSALNLAEAGVERAIWEIRYNSEISNFTIPVSSFQPSTGDSMGEYEAMVTLPDSNSATIISHGYVPNKSSYKAKKTVMVTYSFHRAFGQAIAGVNSITMSGQAFTDSYDSRIGAYNALVDGVRNIGQEGDIASNGAITLGSNTYVNGNANPGKDYPFSGTPPVSGSYGTLQTPLVVDPIILPNNISLVNNNDSINTGDPPIEIFTPGTKNLVLSGTTQIVLPDGIYYFTSITMSGQSSIKVKEAAKVYIYIDGASGGKVNVNITGQGIMNIGKPADLIIYYTGSAIKLAGQASFSGAIYAPSATVTMSGQADIYGSIVCGSNVDSGQASVHYDEALANIKPSWVADKVTSWQEIIE